jgi:hypothetical protein
VIGAAAGLFLMVIVGLVVFVVAAMLGASTTDVAPLIALTVAFFAGQFLAGYTAGRFAEATVAPVHGSFAALGLYGIVGTLSLAAGSQAPAYTIVIFAAVSLVIGLSGGVLAARPGD